MKQLFTIALLYIYALTPVLAKPPEVNCVGLPGCPDFDLSNPTSPNITATKNIGLNFIWAIVSNGIKYIAVIAVICLMLAGVKYIISMGDDEKVGKAKMWIIYSLVWVLLSVSGWTLINVINDFKI